MSPPLIAPLCGAPFDWRGAIRTLPGVTRDGEPWLRWAKIETESGWYAVGTRQQQQSKLPLVSFWERTFELALQVGNGNMDAVHGVGPGVLSAGAVGFTAVGELANLLAACLTAAPERVVSALMPAWRLTGAHPVLADRKGIWLFANAEGRAARTHAEIEQLLRGDKSTGKEWVRCVSNLLKDDHFDAVQKLHFVEAAERAFTEEQRKITHWPAAGAANVWTYTEEQQALWCTVLLLSLLDTPVTTALLNGAMKASALETLLAMRELTKDVDPPFGDRALRVLSGAAETFAIRELA